MYINGSEFLTFPNFEVLLSLRIVYILTNSVDPDEFLLCVAFHRQSSRLWEGEILAAC